MADQEVPSRNEELSKSLDELLLRGAIILMMNAKSLASSVGVGIRRCFAGIGRSGDSGWMLADNQSAEATSRLTSKFPEFCGASLEL